MPSKGEYKQTHGDAHRAFLERKTTEELRAALDPLTPPEPRSFYIGDGGRTLIRQILAEREAANH